MAISTTLLGRYDEYVKERVQSVGQQKIRSKRGCTGIYDAWFGKGALYLNSKNVFGWKKKGLCPMNTSRGLRYKTKKGATQTK